MVPNEAILDQLIGNQHRAIRYYLFFTIALVALGISVMIFGSLSAASLNTEGLKSLFQIGGALVSALGALPIKEILNRKEKAGIFETVRNRLAVGQGAVEEAERNRLDNLIWQVVEKTALG
jgi:hypothetical protein